MTDFSEPSTREEWDYYLKDKYGLGLNWFHYSLSSAWTSYDLRSKKKNLARYRKNLEYLESFESKILKRLEGMMSKSGLSKDIERKPEYRSSDLTREQLHEEIKRLFHLEPIFNRINEKIIKAKKQILLLETFSIKILDRRKSIQPLTMVALVWLIAMKKARKQRRYRDVIRLLNWFSNNHREEIVNKYERLLNLSESALRRAYERYIERPNRKNRAYKEIVYEFYDSSLDDNF